MWGNTRSNRQTGIGGGAALVTIGKTGAGGGVILVTFCKSGAGSGATLAMLGKTGGRGNTRRSLNIRGVYGARDEAQSDQMVVYRSDGFCCDGFDKVAHGGRSVGAGCGIEGSFCQSRVGPTVDNPGGE